VLSRDRGQLRLVFLIVLNITMVVKVAISGAAGRMGRRLMSLAVADADVELVQALEYAAHPLMGKVTCCAGLLERFFSIDVLAFPESE
jgi:hypothetical protein